LRKVELSEEDRKILEELKAEDRSQE